jgi:hypothetical protein
MNGRQILNSLELNNDGIIHEQIKPQPGIKFNTLISNGNEHLRLNHKPSTPQFVGQACFINVFKQSRPEFLMNGKRRIDDCGRHSIVLNRDRFSWCLCALVVHTLIPEPKGFAATEGRL